MFHLTENQVTAIELLAQFKYLTSSQFVEMWVYKKKRLSNKSVKTFISYEKTTDC